MISVFVGNIFLRYLGQCNSLQNIYKLVIRKMKSTNQKERTHPLNIDAYPSAQSIQKLQSFCSEYLLENIRWICTHGQLEELYC